MNTGGRQYPLHLPVEPAMDRDAFIVSGSNAQAAALIDKWPDWPGPHVLLIGPPGSGKTHLASVWQTTSGADRFLADALPAGLPDGVANVVIEDADRGTLDETGLFHIMNTVRQRGGHMVITARTPPGSWAIKTPDLLSRLRAATSVEITAPDDALLRAVLMKLFADRQIVVASGVIEYLATRIERSVEAAISIVDALDQAALARKSAITKPLAAAVLAETGRRSTGFDF